MAQRMTCHRGHQWDALAGSDGGTDVTAAICPYCGAPPRPAKPGAVTATPAQAPPPGTTPGAAPPVTRGSGKVFWIAMLLVVFVGIVGLLVLPFVFPSL